MVDCGWVSSVVRRVLLVAADSLSEMINVMTIALMNGANVTYQQCQLPHHVLPWGEGNERLPLCWLELLDQPLDS